MAKDTVVLFGEFAGADAAIEPLSSEFGWTSVHARTLDCLKEICSRRTVSVVLIDSSALAVPWKRAVASVRGMVPGAFLILGHRLSNQIDWAEASRAGVFHLLGLPLDLGEVRQSLGFAWAAQHKNEHPAPLLSAPAPRAKRSKAPARRAIHHVA